MGTWLCLFHMQVYLSMLKPDSELSAFGFFSLYQCADEMQYKIIILRMCFDIYIYKSKTYNEWKAQTKWKWNKIIDFS